LPDKLARSAFLGMILRPRPRLPGSCERDRQGDSRRDQPTRKSQAANWRRLVSAAAGVAASYRWPQHATVRVVSTATRGWHTRSYQHRAA